ncbi:hypothetical protein PBCVNY2B_935L [Paramecium bursaria Chlorella virus NY2B]|nr:hypothetical protein PBCVMA1D_922L [Paramecium bursaria Chlorella virus MA1D]AGE58565.1 hypothetical protein PBCVNY2B_935L [Paramecium bursaria Chlorella virus NY2B]
MPQALSLGDAPAAQFQPCDVVVHYGSFGFYGFYDFRDCLHIMRLQLLYIINISKTYNALAHVGEY